MKNTTTIFTLAAATISFCSSGIAADSEARERGLEIASLVDRNDSGYGDYVVTGHMTLIRPDGRSARRTFEMSTLEGEGIGDKRITVFSLPRDLAGFTSLTFSNLGSPDDQWIYLPATKRVKRLAARDKTGPFAGSEFSFEDIATWQVENYDYEFVRDEPCGEPQTTCHTIINMPKNEYSGYSRLIETIDPRIWQPVHIIYMDKVGNAVKRLDFHDYQQYGKYWRPDRIVMTNLQDHAKSEIVWENYRFNTGLKAADMTDTRLPAWSR